MAEKDTEEIDISEQGRGSDGQVICSDQRLFMKLLVYSGCTDSKILTPALGKSGIECVQYEELNDPQGIGLLTEDSDPNDFLQNRKLLLNKSRFIELQQKPEYTLFGRT